MSEPTQQEHRLAATNATFFLREFSFSRTMIQQPGSTEVQLADHVVNFDNDLLLFQFKARGVPSAEPATEEKWFANTVRKKAANQLKDTLRNLAVGPIRLENDQGHAVELPRDLAGLRVSKVIVYQPGSALPERIRRQKGRVSSTAGFIHFLQERDYTGILDTLVALPEIVDYLGHRARMCMRFPSETGALSERAMVGHYLFGDQDAVPREQNAEYLQSLRNDVEEFDILGLLNIFKDRTYGIQRSDGSKGKPTDYYEILKEMARLYRTDLAAFKLRYKWAWDCCGGDLTPPSLFASGTSGCGFVFVPFSPEAAPHAAIALQNLTAAAKYDLRVDRCLGLAFRRDGTDRLIDWTLHAHAWAPDAELEVALRESYPFRERREECAPRYKFNV